MLTVASAIGVTCLLAAATIVSGATPAGADVHGTHQPGPYYVAIGASESVGVQPVPGRTGVVPTDDGYANDLVAMEQDRWPGLHLVQFGCPGITSQGALDGTGPCTYPAGSEVATAVRFMRDHPGQTVLVTIDLGFNDMWPCVVHRAVDPRCVDTGLARIARTLPTIIAQLRAAGGPRLTIVGLEHSDPYIAAAHFGASDFARSTVAVFDRLNDVLGAIYARAGVAVAKVPEATGTGVQERAVTQMCALTWMCDMHNIHPTVAGYRAIAGAVAAAIPSAPRAAAG